jgi:hypothetical protein
MQNDSNDTSATHVNVATQNDMGTQLERLVCGELDEAARRPLLAWLDEEPRRWRLCGLLFLEAQTWTDAIQTDGLEKWPGRTVSPQPTVTATQQQKQAAPKRRGRDLAILAASVFVAFVLGAVVERGHSNNGATDSKLAGSINPGAASGQNIVKADADSQRVMAALPIAQKAGLPLQPALYIPVVPGDAHADERDHRALSVSDYQRQQWERRGYHIDVERRYLLAKLPDGQQVAVPFEKYSFKPILPKIN